MTEKGKDLLFKLCCLLASLGSSIRLIHPCFAGNLMLLLAEGPIEDYSNVRIG
jgi:hypothetical protein